MQTHPIPAVLAGILCIAASSSYAAPGYSVVPRLHAPGNQSWDLLTADSSRLYVTHGDRVEVFDQGSGQLLGNVPGIKGAHGVAIVLGCGKGYATSGKDSAVVVFDLSALTVSGRIPTGGAKPDAITYDSASGRVIVGLAGSRELAVIDPIKDTVIGHVELPEAPELMATDGKGQIYVAIEERSTVVVVDTRTLKVKSEWSLTPGQKPTGLAFDAAHGRVFAGCGNRMLVVLNASDGRLVAHLPIGNRIDGVAFDPGLGRIYASGGDGTLTVIREESPDNFRLLETVMTKPGARTVALNEHTHNLWLPTAAFGPTASAAEGKSKPRAPIVPGSFTVLEVSPSH